MLGRYAVRITTSARFQLNQLSPELRERALHKLIQLAEQAATQAPPSSQALRDAHVDPPVLHTSWWPLVIVYEGDPEQRMLTVLHVLCAEARSRPFPEPGYLAELH